MSKHHPEPEPLPLARRRLADAVHALADPLPLWTDGTCRWLPPLYVRLRGSLRNQPPRYGRSVPDSRLPCHSGVLALLVEIDGTVAEWDRDNADTPQRLRDIAAQPHRPQDCALLDSYTARIEAWTLAAVELLGEQPIEVTLRYPCPSCGRRFVYRMSSGENVRSWALRVSEAGARCLGCDATWSAEQFGFLAQLLGCPELPSAS